jgi:hypothetical protein
VHFAFHDAQNLSEFLKGVLFDPPVNVALLDRRCRQPGLPDKDQGKILLTVRTVCTAEAQGN